MGDRLATIDMDRKVAAAVPLSVGELVPIEHNVAWAETYIRRPTNKHFHPSRRFATTDMGRKFGEGVCPFGEGAGSPCNNVAWAEVYIHDKFHLDLFNRLATQTGRTAQDRQRSDSRGRTVLQTVAQ